MDQKRIDLNNKVQALLSLTQSAVRALGTFGPGSPPETWWGDEAPRLFEYQPGINLITTPRAGYGILPYPVLRALATSAKEIRLNIELIKRTIRGLEWDIVAKELKNVQIGNRTYHPVIEIDSIYQFFEQPDGINDFDAWVNMLLEELLVIDAVTIWPEMQDGHLISLDLIDGATIRPLLDLRGRTPRPPMPAYLQVLHGAPTTHYSADKLIYVPLNTKVHTPYGESPIEWILMAVNTAIRHDLQRLGYFTDGNIPGILVAVSPEWGVDQIKTFTEYFDALVKGDIQRANRIMFVPGSSAQSVYPINPLNADESELDEWLMQVACWAFGNSPAEFGITPGAGLGGAGYMQGAENVQYRAMVGPITGYLKALFDRIIREYMHRPDVEFKWIGLEPPEDELKTAQVDQIYLNMGVYSPEYVQSRLGIPTEFRSKSQLEAYLPYIQRAIKAELADWRDRSRRSFKRGERMIVYRSKIIPDDLYADIATQLQKAESLDAIDAAFEHARIILDTELTKIVPAREVGEVIPFRYP
ncbi:hypothetical protein C4588_04145 [Candidatus Parcubacteria bacterium]|jgi:hypothetical protein|nr:MAG: hypothetical protein C4588_04145 [Candidatus Parcubacteria bacterium]